MARGSAANLSISPTHPFHVRTLLSRAYITAWGLGMYSLYSGYCCYWDMDFFFFLIKQHLVSERLHVLLIYFFSGPSIKTEPVDEYESDHMGFTMAQILGLSPHSYYQNPRGGLHPDSGLISGMASCQRLGSSLPSQDVRFQQQSPAIVYSRGGKSLSGGPGGLCQQTGGLMPDPHRSVLVHTGSPAPSAGPTGGGQPASIIQFSTTNQHLLRGGDPQPLAAPQPDGQQIVYCDGFSPQAAAAGHSPTPPQAQTAMTHPQRYPTVIQQQQQQPYVQKEQQKGQTPPGAEQMEAPGDVQRRVTVKEENLDQAYLDDGECKLMLLYSV